MKFLNPTDRPRINEAVGVVFLCLGLALALAIASYHPFDNSWNTSTHAGQAHNLIGPAGAWAADGLLQVFGFGAWAVPLVLFVLAWKWIRSRDIEAPWVRVFGWVVFALSTSALFSMAQDWRPIGKVIPASGLVGMVAADFLRSRLNSTGATIATIGAAVLSLYLISTFSVSMLLRWLEGPTAFLNRRYLSLRNWWERRAKARKEKARLRAAERAAARAAEATRKAEAVQAAKAAKAAAAAAAGATALSPSHDRNQRDPGGFDAPIRPQPGFDDDGEDAPFEPTGAAAARRSARTPGIPSVDEIPIKPLEELEPKSVSNGTSGSTPARQADPIPAVSPARGPRKSWNLPAHSLLQQSEGRLGYDSVELKETALRIKQKFEEFNVLGNVVQINPGPVVTTFEFKPEAGVKYNRITSLNEDLCLGLQAESVLIERIPGKPTVGIEVPNSKREVISLREILESDEFNNSASKMTISLGKDISGRIKVAALEQMPHLLIAGSTGSGKSVMLNTLIMSVLYKSTPDDVRMILVDPKRLELGLYEGIPHLLTPVITDPKKATNALRNAVLEMERRLKLLAAQGVRNIDQYNKKVRQMLSAPRNLFDEQQSEALDDLQPLPFILIIIDELADLMMLERAGVEESVTRLAQMARAVGMHLVLATQRPSVDVITGLIKANFPSRISFRVATRVDSRTVLDSMGAEHLLGKGDMLFMPPGTSRLTRVHGSYVSESETNGVVDFWKAQADPEYDKSYLLAPPSDDDVEGEDPDLMEEEDPMYRDAVRVICEMGKGSTSILQRRLRLGYGRAARILDRMQREGIIGPPDGSRPREVLRTPDWLYADEEEPVSSND